MDDPLQNECLRHELLSTRNEYDILYNFYLFETEQKAKLEAELKKETELKNEIAAELAAAHQSLNLVVQNKTQENKLKSENRLLEESYANKCLEVEHLKAEIDDTKKHKNALSVALKGSKQKFKEQQKAFTKEKEALEQKIGDLYNYKINKLSEEMDERARKKKEIKKAKQKENMSTTKNIAMKDQTKEGIVGLGI